MGQTERKKRTEAEAIQRKDTVKLTHKQNQAKGPALPFVQGPDSSPAPTSGIPASGIQSINPPSGSRDPGHCLYGIEPPVIPIIQPPPQFAAPTPSPTARTVFASASTGPAPRVVVHSNQPKKSLITMVHAFLSSIIKEARNNPVFVASAGLLVACVSITSAAATDAHKTWAHQMSVLTAKSRAQGSAAPPDDDEKVVSAPQEAATAKPATSLAPDSSSASYHRTNGPGTSAAQTPEPCTMLFGQIPPKDRTKKIMEAAAFTVRNGLSSDNINKDKKSGETPTEAKFRLGREAVEAERTLPTCSNAKPLAGMRR